MARCAAVENIQLIERIVGIGGKQDITCRSKAGSSGSGLSGSTLKVCGGGMYFAVNIPCIVSPASNLGGTNGSRMELRTSVINEETIYDSILNKGEGQMWRKSTSKPGRTTIFSSGSCPIDTSGISGFSRGASSPKSKSSPSKSNSSLSTKSLAWMEKHCSSVNLLMNLHLVLPSEESRKQKIPLHLLKMFYTFSLCGCCSVIVPCGILRPIYQEEHLVIAGAAR